MAGRVFTVEDIRAIVGAIEQPVVATRGEVVVAVNDAWLRERGFRREEIEGASVTQLVRPEERDRLVERTHMTGDDVSFTAPLQTITKNEDGSVVPIRVYTSRFPAAEEPQFRVSIVLTDVTPGLVAAFSLELLSLSAELIGAKSRAEVRERTTHAFERAGLRGRFHKRAADVADFDHAVAERALEARTPIFVGSAVQAEAVYVPVGDDELLVVRGPSLTGQHAYAFGFFGKLVTTALLDVQANEAARRKLADTELVLQLARTTSESLDLEVVLGTTADSLVKLLDVSSCFVLLYDEKTNELRGGASSHERRDVVKHIALSLDDPTSISAKAAREGHVIVIADASRDPLARRAPLVAAFNETALAAFPMFPRGGLAGVVLVDDTRGPRTFSAEWLELATAMVAQVGLSISNARLYDSLRKSYEEVAATRAEMVKRERLAGLGELAAIVAHEVRNPLGVIYNATGALERMTAKTPDAATLVGIVKEECERLNQIVGDLLDFARPRRLSLQPEDIPRVLGEVVESLGLPANVRCEVTVDADLPPVIVDRRLLRQALVNVALNGVQAMPRGGTLHLVAAADAATRELVLEIRDEGPGIPEADLPRVFEPFFTTKATGAGLGLAVVKRIVEEHGGHVTVASTPKGATFSFRLPLVRAAR
ncbi:MAG TPA: ATP-binding protein [Polyangiaceae bacterium]